MHRRIPLLTALLAALVTAAAFAATSHSAPAAKPAKAGSFRQVLATKLGAQLNKPATDVLAALKAANQQPASKADRREKLAAALKARAEALAKGQKPDRKANREAASKKQAAWTAAVAKSLNVSADQVTAAVKALVKERLDSLVQDGWLTTAKRDKILARPNVGVGLLRKGL